MPYFFYSEQDTHAYLYHKLISGKLGEFFVETHFGDKSVLLHREYPTLRAYSGGIRGHFDLAIIDPNMLLEAIGGCKLESLPILDIGLRLCLNSASMQ